MAGELQRVLAAMLQEEMALTGETGQEVCRRLLRSIANGLPAQSPPARAIPSTLPPGYEPMVDRAVAERMKELG